MTDAVSFIRAQMGRMSDAQIMRNLGLRRLDDYRELRAQAMVQGERKEVEPRRHDRILRRRKHAEQAPRVVELLARAACMTAQQLIAPQGADQVAARDLLVWLLRLQNRQSPGTISRLLAMTEYAVGLSVRRYDNAIACGIELAQHAQWREIVSRQLRDGT